MKVLLLNGSPRKEGCTYTALTEIAETLKKNGVEAEIFQAGDPAPEMKEYITEMKKAVEIDGVDLMGYTHGAVSIWYQPVCYL